MLPRIEGMVRDAERAKHGNLGAAGLPFREISLACVDCWREHLCNVLDTRMRHGTARLQGLKQTWFHLVSSQMACHYAFESIESAEMLLKNVSDRLCPGGYFVGTLCDASRIVTAQRQEWERTGTSRMGNDVFEVEFEPAQWERVVNRPELWQQADDRELEDDMFGLMYRYRLTDAVDKCYEPLVHFGAFQRLASRHGLVPCMRPKPLADIVAEAQGDGDAKAETGRLRRVYFYKGGMNCAASPHEQEILKFYIAFAFQKEGAEGVPCAQLSEGLRALHESESKTLRMPRQAEDIVRV
eukprot:gnl/TRDRNA2_/TRDRNA2_153716_c0_seq1.p1 gnl/TRDRNA2_/TRDRNA2_153716_c0~~gnl/TRDRNA2_/TRDRNA2_153716_c0_seq1.p1  ORF type:complete len:333 (+),score=45.79 gnl/TRDRNA2_/TRDRNA2_153716_c0_seq1:108-1001(+)